MHSTSNASPALSLNRRLQAFTERPSWATYLPIELQPNLRNSIETSKAADHRSPQPFRPNEATLDVSQVLCMPMINKLPDAKAQFDFMPFHGTSFAQEHPRSAQAPVTLHKGSLSASALTGRVWALARDPKGCREVQEALDSADNEEVRVAMVAELHHHVWEAMRCPHANFVIQKAIALLRPDEVQFVVDEIVEKGHRAIAQAAKHKFGCRIIQRLLEHCSGNQLKSLSDGLLSDAVSTARHPYGNYVMQQLLEYGTDKQKHTLIEELQKHACAVGTN